MGEIIQFPEKRNNGYYNLAALFEICDSVASCNKSGWNAYRVTNRAYDLLKTRYAISWESCLD